jgi:glycosyltransferase involved in cell wall biosynthesis
MQPGKPSKVAICIITYKRPDGLRRLLEGIALLEFQRAPRPEIEVVIVDNDPLGSAIPIAEALHPHLAWRMITTIEPRRGIPYARNTALATAAADADHIVFIDDDEVPEPRWLDELLAAQINFRADVVTGPVQPHFMEPVPSWLSKGGFFAKAQPPTGTRLDIAATSNVLITSAVVRAIDGGFDERLALTGGSDTLFFHRVHRSGFTIVSADDAVVHEWIPAGRATAGWVLRRGFRSGNTKSFCDLALSCSPAKLALRLLQVCERMVLGLISIPFAICFSRKHYKICVLKGLRKTCFGAGMLAGLIGWRYKEYAKTYKV